MTLLFALPLGAIRAMRFFRSGRTACRRTSMPAEFAMSWRNSDTLSSPVKSGRLGSKVGLMLGRATNSRSRCWTGERRGICRSFRICGQGQARTVSCWLGWSSWSRRLISAESKILKESIMVRLLNEPMDSKLFQNKVLVVDTHVAVAVELDTDWTFRFR